MHPTIRLLATLCAGAALLGPAPVHAESPGALEQAVRDLGQLNGVALACRQGALSARMRSLMIEVAPKERGVGEYFEEATSEAFLEMGRNGSECPDGRTLAERIEGVRQALLQAVGGQP
ncbi:hypothetical protein E6C76_02865 [Pseudothauera nasutitermitis]|uniref:Uncharacterized protein n=1 Tax=Pseudothauera nasutitermitis TaxID=2565930 RepID=A0A4S4B3U2_9RHOO|nr:hypothetical protein [Pseudothauera nasutitermitis]THF67332.1 hypothetical protein E6C76_02865 [Pseudothauera nasutitermitis]